jgi:hypothetical protein
MSGASSSDIELLVVLDEIASDISSEPSITLKQTKEFYLPVATDKWYIYEVQYYYLSLILDLSQSRGPL